MFDHDPFHLLELKQRLLQRPGAKRNGEMSPFLQLFNQRLRKMLGRAGDDDGIKGRSLGPAPMTVSVTNMNIDIAQLLQEPGRARRELRHDLDRADLL